jgi:hypothetical protein
MSGAPSLSCVAVQKELRLRQASPTDRCRSQRENQVAEYRAINEGLGSFQEGAKKIIGGVECLSIQSRVERERSTKRLTGDCPDDHSLLEVFPCFLFSNPLATSSRSVSRDITRCLCCCHKLFLSLTTLSLQKSSETCRHSSVLPYLALPTFSNFRVSPQPSEARAFVSTNILLLALSQTVAPFRNCTEPYRALFSNLQHSHSYRNDSIEFKH